MSKFQQNETDLRNGRKSERCYATFNEFCAEHAAMPKRVL